MANRYVRIYESPATEHPASILGFSRPIEDGAFDSGLHAWLSSQGHEITAARRINNKSAEVVKKDGSPIDDRQPDIIALSRHDCSAAHLLIEPPIAEEELKPLGEFLVNMEACKKNCILVDNRSSSPAEQEIGQLATIAAW